MTKKVNIRRYSSKDKNAIINLLRLNTPQYFAASEESDLIYYLENYVENYYVIENENEIVGCGGFNFSDDLSVGKISWDIFHPQHQGAGFGSLLLKYRIEKLKRYKSITTISVRTSQLVYVFYEKLGFKLIEVIKDYWADGFDLYSMEYKENLS